ncbi:cobalt-precorrin 3 C17-methyltransferase [Natranaerovirga hydrolytica]|uniref:Cobalt-precorrin 3 C17-methyltransferase n=1 Tax=Natranaerovirga hydrolytica TaxID=680378 RepID=A0A4R1N3L8_9FIRM|nr:precorrin-3B C(17)-methyltransferase [Natranaerovirga hydrolytica]TCK98654.1 cobalt-precorrin 3 C17-methyltransferase [Natranaerovirga hydrolytica]
MKHTVYAIGIGPGHMDLMTLQAQKAILDCDAIVGYTVYIKQIQSMIQDKLIYENGMGNEIKRCEQSIKWALDGKKVAMVCSGDASLYGMAGLLEELVEKHDLTNQIEIEVIPGVSAAFSCSALLGAPIVEDFCTISLSDYMTPLETIFNRIQYAGKGDFTIALYNPRSKKRPHYLEQAIHILQKERDEHTPVGIVRQAYRQEQEIIRTTLNAIPYEKVDMFATMIIGNSKTRWINNKMVTSRGYDL